LILMVVILYIRMLFTIDGESYNTMAATYDMGFTSFGTAFPSIGIVAFAFVCHDTSFLVYSTLYLQTMNEWARVCVVSQGFAVLICMLFSLPAYLMFGSNVQSNILNCFQNTSSIMFIRIIYLVSMCFSYPMSFYVIRHIFYSAFQIVLRKKRYESLVTLPRAKLIVVYTLPLFVANVVLALFVTDLGVVMSVSGSLAAMTLAFILPSAVYLKLTPFSVQFWKEKDARHQWLAIKHTLPSVLLFVGGICVGAGCAGYTIWQSVVSS